MSVPNETKIRKALENDAVQFLALTTMIEELFATSNRFAGADVAQDTIARHIERMRDEATEIRKDMRMLEMMLEGKTTAEIAAAIQVPEHCVGI